MSWLDDAIAYVSPAAAVRRAQARQALAYYEAARLTRLRKKPRDGTLSGDQLVSKDAAALRAWARHLDKNHDIARGILNVICRNVVGDDGIGVEPAPLNRDGTINDDLARQLLELWIEFCEAPCVTGTRDMGMVQRLKARSWLRDGDVFSQLVSGPVPGLKYPTRIPMAVELIEADHCPLDLEDVARGIVQGVRMNAWRQPLGYQFTKQHPGEGYAVTLDTKEILAANITHLANLDRISQVRGISLFASVITRLDDLKDYEESERVAARIAASMAAYVKKGSPTEYQPATNADGSTTAQRLLRIEPGTIFDDLQPGEEIGTISTDRPNSGLGEFRKSQVRAVAAGVDVSNSSISRDYNGTYSAQRQELVEQQSSYDILASVMVARDVRPTYKRFVATVIQAGLVKVPPTVRLETVARAQYMAPLMPWIDPVKEVDGLKSMNRAGYKSATQIIRERGGTMHGTYAELARERALAKQEGLVLENDAASDADYLAAQNAAANASKTPKKPPETTDEPGAQP